MAKKELRVFTISARAAGRAVAHRMLSLGHRTIAFLSVFHKDNWSIRRLQGIREVYDKAGLKDRVTTIDLGFPGNYSLFESVLAIIDFPKDKIVKLFGVDLPEELVKDLLIACEAARKSGTLPAIDRRVIAKIRSDFEMLIGCVDGNLNPGVLARTRDLLVVSSWNLVLEKGLEPRFARLLENSDATAWIASDDVTAMAAVRNLNTWKVAIPGRLSIASFDNSPDSFEQGLTSYDFNIPGVVRQVLLFMASTPGLNRVHAYRPIEVPGVLIERRSTATVISSPISANR
jgi:DNA-binding LacI/PurR family transcriptional regulator